MTAPTRLWLFRLLSVALLALAGLALLLGVMSLQRAQLQNRLDQWRQSPPEARTLSDARAQIAWQLGLMPESAEVLVLAGKLDEWAAQGAAADARAALLASAHQHYRKALQQRPLFAESWTLLALVKWRQGQFDAELKALVSGAERAGPNEPQVHLALTDVGLAGLRVKGFADADWLAMLQRQLQLAARHPHARDALPEILQRHQLQGWGCKQLPGDTVEAVRKKICN